ncbi:SLAC1 anion channel family protein [Azospirillum canadense]|uniref:SLAC1 anion channel family protein n=1 Tax=Azospirillum canadense TaxID=403962 RepID=UPI002226DFCA|nr:SLAC1 anion channel family protein [Azospirillum canadense]MCW2241662.1 tellurite resistance protein [Azospirillum canadense]
MVATAGILAGARKAAASVEKLPVNLFGSVMGIAGLSLAWRQAHTVFGAHALISDAIGVLAISVFAALAVAYIVKTLRYPRAVMAEFDHPVMGNFFGTITIGLLLLSAVVAPHNEYFGQWVWIVGAITTLGLSYIGIQRFLTMKQDGTNTVPPLLIPGVASLDIAVTGATMPFDWAYEVNLFALAIGSVFAVTLFVLIAARFRHFDPMPAPMTPVLLVLIAPFEVGFLAYTNMTHSIDMFSAMLFYFGLFLFLVLVPRVFHPSVPFGVPWWAVSFPMAALSIAALKYASAQGGWGTTIIAALILAALTVLIAVLFVRTLVIAFVRLTETLAVFEGSDGAG